MFVDVLTHSDPAAASALTKKGLFVPFKATDFDKVPAEVKDPKGMHVAQRLNVMAIYVRDDMLPAADRPKTWTDLLNPKYKGKIVMPDPNFSSLLVVITGTLARAPRLEIFRGAAQERHHGGAEQPAGLRHGQARRASDRDGGGRRLCRRRRARQGMKISILYPERRRVRDRVAELGGQRLAQPERGQGLCRLHARAATVQELFPSEFLYSARTDIAGPPGYPPLSSIKIHPGRLRLHRGGKPAHPAAVRGGDAVTAID